LKFIALSITSQATICKAEKYFVQVAQMGSGREINAALFYFDGSV